MGSRIYKMNDAEGIFFPAFDKHLCDDSELSADNGSISRQWDSLSVRGEKHFCFQWDGVTELGEYDGFLAYLAYPVQASITVTAVVDGEMVTLIENEPGGGESKELKAVFPFDKLHNALPKGHVLTNVSMELTSARAVNAVILSWLGIYNSKLLEQAEKKIPKWKEGWEEEIVKDRFGTLENNLVLSPEDGAHLKQMISGGEKLREFFRRNAEEGMKIDHRAIMREYAPTGDYRFVRERDRGRDVVEGPILNLAIAGYLLEEPRYSAHSARLILALIAMKWCEGPICDLEGSRFHHVCFREDHLSTEVILAMGFLGGVFTKEALDRIGEKLEDAWKVVHEKCCEPGYRNFMNQGIVGCRGDMLGALYQQYRKGGCEQIIQEIYERHTKLVNTYLTEEGQCGEGGAYFEYSFSTSILLWHIYAKYAGKTWREVVPEAFRRSGRYQEALISVNSRSARRIPVNCDHATNVVTLLLVFMTLVCDFPEGNNYLLDRFEGGRDDLPKQSFDMLFYLYYKGLVNLHPYYRPQTEEISLAKSGLLTYRNGFTKLLVSAERNPYTGHFHEDRGGIVLEAEGESLLPEPGITSYGNSVSLMMDKKEYHNLAYPSDLRMMVESEAGMSAAAAAAYPITEALTLEDMAIPEAKVLSHEVTKDGYAFSVETGMLFGEGILGIREGKLTQRRLELTDRWEFPEAHPLAVNFLSYEPWVTAEDGQSAVSGRKTLRIKSEQPFLLETEEGMVDSDEAPMYVLRIRAESAETQTVETLLTWTAAELSEENSGRLNRIALQTMLDQGGTVRVEKPGTYEIEDTLYIGGNTKLVLGAGVKFKRTDTGKDCFFMINRGAFTGETDENITVEGLHLITNGVEARKNAAVYGMTGEVCFFRVKHLRIFNFACMDLPRLSYGLHICSFEDIVLERLVIEGRKDAVHLGTGKQFVIRHGIFRTFDDPIALNAHDYAVANPEMGWIEDGLIEDCYDLADADTTGYFCRILAGSWVDWYEGMEIQNSDTVVSSGRLYRAFQQPDGTIYKSMTAPGHAEGMRTLDGINWVMTQEKVVYNCGCRNLHFRDIHLQKKRDVALSIHFDHDKFSRSVYPGSVMPVQENIVFENIVVANETECLVRSITPVDVVKITGSVIGTKQSGNSKIRLETLPGQEGAYGVTRLLLQGNTCYGEEKDLVECGDGRSYELIAAGNLQME